MKYLKYYENIDFQTDWEDDTPGSFKKGDKVLYMRKDSGYYRQQAEFIKINDEGKYSIRFADGKRFAVLPKFVFPITDENGNNIPDILEQF